MSKTTIDKLKSLKDIDTATLYQLKEEARQESYEYFDQNIRPLPKNKDGSFKVTSEKFYNNDVDAFRHAYTSGVFTQKYFLLFANLAGLKQEMDGNNPINQQNMDLWNNAIGRKYGEKTNSRDELANLIKKALENKELIITPNDPREYKGLRHFNYDPKKPVQVIQESKTGRNEYFLDFSDGNVMDRESFVSEIESGKYPGYTVATIDKIATPMSKPDSNSENNLG